MKIAAVIGTRPEAVKMAPLITELKRRGLFSVVTVAAAQHREMLDGALDSFGISAEYDLDIMESSQSLCGIAARCIERLEKVLLKEKPGLVLVHGDTATTLASALTAAYCGIEVGHVEAGLRSYDTGNPFPEEHNRVLTDALSKFHFAPTPGNRGNLLRENISEEGIFVTGNTGIDALLSAAERDIPPENPVLREFESRRFVLVTAHRRENFGEPITRICGGLAETAGRHPDVSFVYPVHPNPEISGPVNRLLSGIGNVLLTGPVSYPDMAWLLKRCYLCVTDSGGIQEEAPSLGKPVLVLREVTERPEAVQAGTVKVIGAGRGAISEWAGRLLSDESFYRGFSARRNPYGDGKASGRIADFLEYSCGFRELRPEEWAPEEREGSGPGELAEG